VASALGFLLADARKGAILLLSVDPAGSLADVLEVSVGQKIAVVPGSPRLFAQQLDAEAAWEEFRSRYRREVETLFSGIAGGGFSADLDRDVVERLVDLAPPGVDELMALLEVIDTIEEGKYDSVILDTAPTGHFLRVLEMPGLALEWTHTVLRLLLKYRRVTGLGDIAERVLKLARTIKSLQARLRNPDRSWIGIVALPESLSVPETTRLLPRLGELAMQPDALIVNRGIREDGSVRREVADSTIQLLGVAGSVITAATPDLRVGPTGPVALRRFAAGWRNVSMTAS
jgi:arsenite-transporting ATPase